MGLAEFKKYCEDVNRRVVESPTYVMKVKEWRRNNNFDKLPEGLQIEMPDEDFDKPLDRFLNF